MRQSVNLPQQIAVTNTGCVSTFCLADTKIIPGYNFGTNLKAHTMITDFSFLFFCYQ